MAALVRDVDHFTVVLDDIDSAVAFLVDDLGLPLLRAASAGPPMIGLGNANFELMPAGRPGMVARDPARVAWIALTPTLVDEPQLDELDRRGIPHGDPIAWVNFTNTGISGVIRSGGEMPWVTLCDYHHPWLVTEAADPWPINDETRRREALERVDGGVLGVGGVEALLIGATDVADRRSRWQNLLDPLQPTRPDEWRPGVGPAIRLTSFDQDEVVAVELWVRSIERAQAALERTGVPVEAEGGRLTCWPRALAGLELRLTASE